MNGSVRRRGEEEKRANPLGGKLWARMLSEKYSGRVSLDATLAEYTRSRWISFNPPEHSSTHLESLLHMITHRQFISEQLKNHSRRLII
jgi:hypothetical protein